MNSKKGIKVGIIAKTILIFLMPNYIGKLFFKLFPSAIPDNLDGLEIYVIGFFIFICLFLITWIIRAILIWFIDDTGERNPWQWGYLMNDDNY